MTTPLRFGIIGIGGRGGLAYYAHRPEEGVELTAGADIDEDALGLFRDTYGEELYATTDYRALLERDLDAVIIASPAHLREEQAAAALEAGKAVFSARPMALTTEGCDRLLDLARAHGAALYVAQPARYTAIAQKLREIVDSGVIGAVKSIWARHFIASGARAYFKDRHAERAYSGGLLFQEGVDAFDIIQWLTGAPAEAAQAMGAQLVLNPDAPEERNGAQRPDPVIPGAEWPLLSRELINPRADVEDLSIVNLRLASGALAAYQQCHFTPDSWLGFTIIGTRGRIENIGEQEGGAIIRVWNQPLPYFNPYGDEEHQVPREPQKGNQDQRMVAEFIAWLRDGAPPMTTPLEARNAVAAACAATRSLRTGGATIPAPPPSDALRAHFRG